VHGWKAKDFHDRCNSKGATLVVIKTDKGMIFGGYTSVSWESPSSGVYKDDKSAFLFSVNNNKKYPVTDSTKAIWNHSGYGPCFGGACDLGICADT
jgi:hypothetical protein